MILPLPFSKQLLIKDSRPFSLSSQVRIFPRYAGCRPGRRGPFVSAKGPKTISAPAWSMGFPARRTRIRWLRNSLRSNSARRVSGFSSASRPRRKAGKHEGPSSHKKKALEDVHLFRAACKLEGEGSMGPGIFSVS